MKIKTIALLLCAVAAIASALPASESAARRRAQASAAARRHYEFEISRADEAEMMLLRRTQPSEATFQDHCFCNEECDHFGDCCEGCILGHCSCHEMCTGSSSCCHGCAIECFCDPFCKTYDDCCYDCSSQTIELQGHRRPAGQRAYQQIEEEPIRIPFVDTTLQAGCYCDDRCERNGDCCTGCVEGHCECRNVCKDTSSCCTGCASECFCDSFCATAKDCCYNCPNRRIELQGYRRGQRARQRAQQQSEDTYRSRSPRY